MADFIKPVVFNLDAQEYGVDINLVNAIERYQQVVPVPNSVSFIKGIINLRGEVVPVYDLRARFNMPPFQGTADNKSLIVIKLSQVLIAFEVDSVSEIHDFTADKIVKMPKIIINEETKFMERVANLDGRLIVLMDVTQLLSPEELEGVKKLKEDLED